MVRPLSLTAGVGLLLLAACQPSTKPQPQTGADSTALTKVRTDFMAAWNDGKVDGVVRLFASNGELLNQDAPRVTGENALRTFYNTAMGTPTRPKLDVPAGMIMGRQDLAVASGSFTFTPPAPPPPPKGAAPPAPAPMTGKYLTVLMRQADGSWKIAYHAISMNAPLAPPAPEQPKRGARR